MPLETDVNGIALNRILFATDFSPAATAALSHALVVARHFGSTLYVAHIIAPKEYAAIPRGDRDTALPRIREYVGEQMTKVRESSLLHTVSHQVLVDEGEVWPTLSAMIDNYKIELVVIGTQGRRGLEKFVLGSIAEEVLRRANCPVLMVGPESSANPEAEAHLQRILYATDFSTESAPAMHYAHWLAKEFKAHLFFLHVTQDAWQEPLATRVSADEFCRLRLMEQGWARSIEDVNPEFLLEFGVPAERIVEQASNLRSELIVLGVPGTHHPEIVAHLPGPTAYDVVSHAHCPVLAVRGVSSGAINKASA
ncbi:MAG TPA: universal stress protein [Candidatus Deferrimicrobiaceae bacterium]|nr:universal stress protein [Candidatus Deferrimicrobiaceae bacterium]